MAKARIRNTIRRLRAQADGMTQRSLAEAVGCTRQTIVLLEQGRYVPSLALAMRVAHAFGRRVEDVFELLEDDVPCMLPAARNGHHAAGAHGASRVLPHLEPDEEPISMNVSSVMSPHPLTVQAGAPVHEALTLMDRERIRHLPVLDGEHAVGVVSDCDLLGVAGAIPPRGPEGRAARVRDVMQRLVVSIAPEADVVDAAREMLRERVGCLPVLHEGRLVGLVTEFDVLAVLARAAASGRLGPEGNPALRDLHRAATSTLPPDASFEDAAALCRERRVRQVPVLRRDGRLVGLLTDRDLRAAAGAGTPGGTPISEIMTEAPATLAPDDTVARAAQVLLNARAGAAPLVDTGRVDGMVTVGDLLAHAVASLEGMPATP